MSEDGKSNDEHTSPEASITSSSNSATTNSATSSGRYGTRRAARSMSLDLASSSSSSSHRKAAPSRRRQVLRTQGANDTSHAHANVSAEDGTSSTFPAGSIPSQRAQSERSPRGYVQVRRQFLRPEITDVSQEFRDAEKFLYFAVGDDVLKSHPNMMPFLKASWYRMMQYIWSVVDTALTSPQRTDTDASSGDIANAHADSGSSGVLSTATLSAESTAEPATSSSSASEVGTTDTTATVAEASAESSVSASSSSATSAASKKRRGDLSNAALELGCTQESCRVSMNFTLIPFLYAIESMSTGSSKTHGKAKVKVAKKIGIIKSLSASLGDVRPSSESTDSPFSRTVEEFMRSTSREERAGAGAGAGAAESPKPYVMPMAPRDLMQTTKTDSYRLCLQKLFLFCLRRFIPLKYPGVEALLDVYPEFLNRDAAELKLLRDAANWFDLILHTIKSQNNKSFLIAFVPHLSEGRNAKYITGSGESQKTCDRICIFRKEGGVERVTRAPRVRKPKGQSHDSNDHFTDSDNSDIESYQHAAFVEADLVFEKPTLSPKRSIPRKRKLSNVESAAQSALPPRNHVGVNFAGLSYLELGNSDFEHAAFASPDLDYAAILGLSPAPINTQLLDLNASLNVADQRFRQVQQFNRSMLTGAGRGISNMHAANMNMGNRHQSQSLTSLDTARTLQSLHLLSFECADDGSRQAKGAQYLRNFRNILETDADQEVSRRQKDTLSRSNSNANTDGKKSSSRYTAEVFQQNSKPLIESLAYIAKSINDSKGKHDLSPASVVI